MIKLFAMGNRFFSLATVCLLLFKTGYAQENVTPSKEHISWADAEMGVIIHLDINIYAPETFDYAKKETLPEVNAFNPARLNTDQWIRTAKAAGAKYAVLTAKHGTGFCLWPSKVNPYNVGHTSWRNGQADIIKEFIASCKKYDIKPGLYYNTNINTFYGAGDKPFASDEAQQDYHKAVLQQLTELWSNYGELFEIWFDGGVMSDKEKGIALKVISLIHNLQPRAILFQGPLEAKHVIRWVGNEDGIAAYPQWSRANASTNSLGLEKIEGLHGEPDGRFWCPAESDSPIRKNNAWNGGWLWRSGQENYLLNVSELTDKYYKSVGRNTNMLVGMVVDTSGLIPVADSLVFDSLGKKIKMLFDNPVAMKKNIHEKEIVFNLNRLQKLNRTVIQEDIAGGENIRNYVIEAIIDNRWIKIAGGESVGHKRIEVFDPVITDKIRVRIVENAGPVNVKEIKIY